MQKIKISELKSHPRNNDFFENITGAKWDEFLDSIKTRGIIEPLIITQDKIIVSGHQRLRAAKKLNITKVPCILKNYENEDEVLKDLIETNIQQRGTVGGTVTQIGNRIKELERLYGVSHGRPVENNSEIFPNYKSQSQLAEESGMTDKTWRNYKQLSEAIPELKELLDTKKVSQTTALAIMNQLSPAEQTALISSLDTTKKITQKEMQAHIKKQKELQEQNKTLREENATLQQDNALLQQDQENISQLISQYPDLQSLIDTGIVTPGILKQLFDHASTEDTNAFLKAINPQSFLLKQIDKLKDDCITYRAEAQDILIQKSNLYTEHEKLKKTSSEKDLEIVGLHAKIKDLENKPPLTDEASAVIINNLNNQLYSSLNTAIKNFTETLQTNATLLKEGKYKAPDITQTIYDNLQILKDWLTTNLI